MKHAIAILLLVWSSFLHAGEESPDDIAKRVIAEPISENKLSGEKDFPQGIGSSQEDFLLADAGDHSRDLMRDYMLGNSATEKVRIAYAITLLAKKRHPQPSIGRGVFFVDRAKNEQYLKDGLVLVSRLAEIEKAEQASAGQPATRPESKPEGSDKPQPEAEGRSR
jgi:hypothetical protein